MRTSTEEDTYKTLRGATYREMFLMLTENVQLGDDIVIGKEELLMRNGWTKQSFLEVFFYKYKTALNTTVIRDPEWRAKFLAEDDGGR